jgi:glycosyltransferase involved in cell wall biosynthesis
LNTSPVSFSVLIPNYNHAAYLPQCLDSVIAQSCQPDAIHVIDDASTDRSVEVIGSYLQRFDHVHLTRNEKNRGYNANINGFLPQLKSTHVFCLGADDYLLPGAIEIAYAMLSAHPDAGFCLTDILEVFPDHKQRLFRYQLSPEPAYFPPAGAPSVLRGRPLVAQCFLHLDGLRQMGGFPESLRWHADHFACSVLALRRGFCYVPKAGAAFRKLPMSDSGRGMEGAGEQEVMARFLECLCRPEFSDIKRPSRESQMLAIFDRDLLSTLWQNPNYRYFLSPALVRKLLLRRLRRVIRHPVPRPVKEWFRRRSRRQGRV